MTSKASFSLNMYLILLMCLLEAGEDCRAAFIGHSFP